MSKAVFVVTAYFIIAKTVADSVWKMNSQILASVCISFTHSVIQSFIQILAISVECLIHISTKDIEFPTFRELMS